MSEVALVRGLRCMRCIATPFLWTRAAVSALSLERCSAIHPGSTVTASASSGHPLSQSSSAPSPTRGSALACSLSGAGVIRVRSQRRVADRRDSPFGRAAPQSSGTVESRRTAMLDVLLCNGRHGSVTPSRGGGEHDCRGLSPRVSVACSGRDARAWHGADSRVGGAAP